MVFMDENLPGQDTEQLAIDYAETYRLLGENVYIFEVCEYDKPLPTWEELEEDA